MGEQLPSLFLFLMLENAGTLSLTSPRSGTKLQATLSASTDGLRLPLFPSIKTEIKIGQCFQLLFLCIF